MERRIGDRVQIPGDYQHNAYYSGKSPQRFWHFAKLSEAEKALEIKDGDEILDVGCGSGLFSHFLAKYKGTTITAIDSNVKAIEFARLTYKESNIDFKVGLLDELALPENKFNKIAFLEVLEHISENQGTEIIKTFHRLLRPGGKLVISTPNRLSLWPLTEWIMDFFRLTPDMAEGQHEHLYSATELINRAEQAGFVLHKKSTINTFAPWVSALNWNIALKVHGLEMKYIKKYGSILLCTFYKKEK